MNVKLLIDSIMQQTTLLIGQLSTAAGIRAPLSRMADQVFLDLARELDAQGVPQRVAADMFGLALRSYQKKVRRLTESASVPNRTLWQAVLEYVNRKGHAQKSDILARFRADGEREVGSVLTDLVGSGLVYQTGHGPEALYGITTEADLRYLARGNDARAALPAVWTAVHRTPGVTVEALAKSLGLEPVLVMQAVDTLIAEGKLAWSSDAERVSLRAVDLLVPSGRSSAGRWPCSIISVPS